MLYVKILVSPKRITIQFISIYFDSIHFIIQRLAFSLADFLRGSPLGSLQA